MSLDLADDATFPFARFAEDAHVYRKAQTFWCDAFADVLGNSESDWIAWMPDPFRDGHPIFSRIDRSGQRGLLVQQVPETNDRCWFKCWISPADHTGGDPGPTYLFVETFVSEKARTYFQKLVGAWCAEETDEEAVRRMADDLRTRAERL